MASTRPCTRVAYCASLKLRGSAWSPSKPAHGTPRSLVKAALHLGHITGPRLAGAVVVDEHAVDLIVAADALTPRNALLDTHGVGRLVVGSGHLIHIVVDTKPKAGAYTTAVTFTPFSLRGLKRFGSFGQQGMPSNMTRYFSGKGSVEVPSLMFCSRSCASTRRRRRTPPCRGR